MPIRFFATIPYLKSRRIQAHIVIRHAQARSWKRRIQAKESLKRIGFLYSAGAPRIHGELLKLGIDIG
jgi:hypothetical protein